MQTYLPQITAPEWLTRVDAANINSTPLPLEGILKDSLFYPASRFDGDPVRLFGGNVLSFIYADYGVSDTDLEDELRERDFRGYEVLASRSVSEAETAPNGRWQVYDPADGDPLRFRDRAHSSFARWLVLQRLASHPASHGPERFSLLYLCAEAVATFQAIYMNNQAVPKFVVIIQPGYSLGGNWTNFEDDEAVFARNVCENPAGIPEYLVFGGRCGRGVGEDGGRKPYTAPCWPDYFGERLGLHMKTAEGNEFVRRGARAGRIGVFARCAHASAFAHLVQESRCEHLAWEAAAK